MTGILLRESGAGDTLVWSCRQQVSVGGPAGIGSGSRIGLFEIVLAQRLGLVPLVVGVIQSPVWVPETPSWLVRRRFGLR